MPRTANCAAVGAPAALPIPRRPKRCRACSRPRPRAEVFVRAALSHPRGARRFLWSVADAGQEIAESFCDGHGGRAVVGQHDDDIAGPSIDFETTAGPNRASAVPNHSTFGALIDLESVS